MSERDKIAWKNKWKSENKGKTDTDAKVALAFHIKSQK